MTANFPGGWAAQHEVLEYQVGQGSPVEQRPPSGRLEGGARLLVQRVTVEPGHPVRAEFPPAGRVAEVEQGAVEPVSS